MVELDVRQDCDLGRQREDGAVRLVTLDHEVSGAEARVRAELRDRRADQPGGVASGLAQCVGDHRGGRPLPVRTGDDDRAPRRDELAQELRAPHPRNARVGGGDDRLPAVGHDRVGRDLDAHALERLEVRRADAVPAADLRAPGACELCVRAETCAADPDEPQPAAGHGRDLSRAIATSSSAISSAASGRATARIALPISSRRAGSSSSERTMSVTPAMSSSRTMIAPPACTKCCALCAWWSPVANGYGTKIAGRPAAAISHTVEPERASTRSLAEMAAPKRSVSGSTR